MPGAFWALAIFIGVMSAIVGGVLMGYGYPIIGWPVVISGSIATAIIIAQGRRVGPVTKGGEVFFKRKLHLKPNHIGYVKEAKEWDRLFNSHRFEATGTEILTEDEARWIRLGACKDCEVKTMLVVNLVRDEAETEIIVSKEHGEALTCGKPGSEQAQGVLGLDLADLTETREDFREYSDADPLRDEVRALYTRVMEQHLQTDKCPRHKPSLW